MILWILLRKYRAVRVGLGRELTQHRTQIKKTYGQNPKFQASAFDQTSLPISQIFGVTDPMTTSEGRLVLACFKDGYLGSSLPQFLSCEIGRNL